MGILLRGGRWHFQKRVPKRFAAVDPRARVLVSLHTDSERVARDKALGVEAELWAYWEALEAGDKPGAVERYNAAVRLAEARGFTYRPAAEIVPGDFAELVARVKALEASPARIVPPREVEAVLGEATAPRLTVSEGLEEFLKLSADRRIGKSEYRQGKWVDERRNSVANFVAIIGDKDMSEVTITDAEAFRAHWIERVKGGASPNTANRQIGNLGDVFRTVAKRLARPDIGNPFQGLRLSESKGTKKTRPPFSTLFLFEKVCAPGALDRLNPEARAIFQTIVNTGARPSEITRLGPERDIVLDAPIPHLVFRFNEQGGLKTEGSERRVPLVGISLEGARALKDMGGAQRYLDNENSLSGCINKYLREKDRLPRSALQMSGAMPANL